jgi:hypothetical protein
MHITDDELTAHYYGELSEAAEQRAAAHLEECEVCHASLARLKRVMAAIDMVAMPEPPAEFSAKAWSRLQPALTAESVQTTRRVFALDSPWKLGAWGSIAAGILIATFLAGRMWPGNPATGSRSPTTTAGNASSTPAGDAGGVEAGGEALREGVLLVDLNDHLDRTEQTLVEFVNRTDVASDGGAQTRTEDLVSANRLYRGTAEATGDMAVTDVLDDLERTLIEIAGVPANAPASELEAIRRRIDARDLLFKLRVMRMELEQRASDPRPAKRQGPRT